MSSCQTTCEALLALQIRLVQISKPGDRDIKTCREVMTKDPICCLPVDRVDQVAKLMRSGDIGSVPVIANRETGQLVGIVTDRDLALRVIAEGYDSHRTRVEAVMTPNPWTCRADDPLEDAIDIMTQERIRRVPVVEDGDRIVGIISQADIATRTDNPQQTAEVIEQISQLVGGLQIQ